LALGQSNGSIELIPSLIRKRESKTACLGRQRRTSNTREASTGALGEREMKAIHLCKKLQRYRKLSSIHVARE